MSLKKQAKRKYIVYLVKSLNIQANTSCVINVLKRKKYPRVKILIIQCMQKAILKINSQKKRVTYNESYKNIQMRWQMFNHLSIQIIHRVNAFM